MTREEKLKIAKIVYKNMNIAISQALKELELHKKIAVEIGNQECICVDQEWFYIDELIV